MADSQVQWDVIDVNEIDKNYKKLLQTGDEAMERKNYDYAINNYRRLLKRYPALEDIRYKLREAQFNKIGCVAKLSNQLVATVLVVPKLIKGAALIKSGNFSDALDNAEQAMSVDPTATVCINLLTRAAEQAELVQTAVSTLEWGTKFHPKDQTMWVWLAECYKDAEMASKAVPIYQKLMSMSPGTARYEELYKNAGTLASMQDGKWTELEKQKSGADFRTVMRDKEQAVLLEQEGRTVRTESGLQKLIEEQRRRIADQDTVENNRHLGELLAEAKMHEEALAQYQHVLDMSEGIDPTIARTMSDIRLEIGKSAVHELETRLREEALSDADREELEQQLVEATNSMIAMKIDSLTERVKRTPNAHDDRFELAQALLEVGEPDGALEHFQMVNRNPSYHKKAALGMGRCFMMKKVYDLAIEQFMTVIDDGVRQVDGLKKEAYYMLGCCHRDMGHREDAIKCFKAIYAVDSKYRDVKNLVEVVYGQAS